MKLKPDKKLRDMFFDLSAKHSAKAHLGMMEAIFERYTQPGQWVLDPMAGIGSSLIGCLSGRNVICLDCSTNGRGSFGR